MFKNRDKEIVQGEKSFDYFKSLINLSLDELVKKLFPKEVILASSQEKVHFFTLLTVKGYSKTSSKEAFYPLDIIETDKKIFFDRKDPTDPLRYFVIDKKDIAKTQIEIKDGQEIRKITMIPKRMYEFQIYHFTEINNTPQDALARIFYKVRKYADVVFGFIVAKHTTVITY